MRTTFYTLLLALGISNVTTMAQITSGVPGYISYQGRVLDSVGALVGLGTPVNRTVTFRVWDHPSNTLQANLIYSEEQTVTIADGEFSVLVGQGVATSTSPFGFSETAKSPASVNIADAFNGEGRYLGVTVDDGTAAPDNEISPRQQVVSSAFAFRSKFAETLGTSASTALTVTDSGNVGIGVSDPLAPLVVQASDNPHPAFNGLHVSASEASPNKHAILAATVNGASGGNPFLSFDVSGVGGWSVGVDNEDQDKFKISNAWNSVSTATKLTLDHAGNVGIGTVTPASRLHVKGDLVVDTEGTARALLVSNDQKLIFKTFWQHNVGQNASINSKNFAENFGNDLHLNNEGGNVFIASAANSTRVNGTLGIGTLPSKAKVHIEGVAFSHNTGGNNGLLYQHNPPVLYSAAATENLSLYASGPIHVQHVRAFSDERIKNVIGTSDSEKDLATLLGIEITDYTMKDTFFKGSDTYKKVIAQQVEKVYPQAVTKSEDIIPDIYQSADIKDGWVSLATNLKKGERVRLVAEDETVTHEVLEVKPNRFRTAFKPKGNRVFVYGREVNDFRLVDYEAIAMLNVSATQELKKEKDREIEQLQEENTALRERLAKLEAKDVARERQLAAIEKLLQPSKATSTSLKPGAFAQ